MNTDLSSIPDNKKLRTLATLFDSSHPLYAVGGYVRNALLGLPTADIDVCSSASVDELKSYLSGSEFAVSDKNLRMGTVLITSRGFKAEYTSFRTESYPLASGVHTPDAVEFTSDLGTDALRRDFRCNALYFNPLNGEIIDPVGGKRDIECRILNTADDPDKVFSADGLRVLRLVRFASQLGFEIGAPTLKAAETNAWRVGDIAPERILSELDAIFVADTAYPSLSLSNAHLRGFRLLDELGLIDMLLPELASNKGLVQPRQWHRFDAYEHSVQAYACSKPGIRWAALLHDVGKRGAKQRDGKMYDHPALGAEMAKNICERLRFPKKRAHEICSLVLLHMYDMLSTTSESKFRWFIAERESLVLPLADLMDADAYASQLVAPTYNRLRTTYYKMKEEGVPFSVKELALSGNDLISLGVPSASRGMLLYELWRDTVMNPDLSSRSASIEYVNKWLQRSGLSPSAK